mgnify:CR=1 FL=1
MDIKNIGVALVAVVIAIFALFTGGSSNLGGSTDSGYNATANGVYAVDGTTVIDGSGNWVGAITGTTGTLSTLSLSGLFTANAGSVASYSLATTTAATTYTLTAADIGNYDTIRQTLTGGATTFTLPATSTLTSLVPSAGDRAETCWMPLTNTLTFAAGTGIDMMVATSTGNSSAHDLTITAGGVGCIKWFRQTDTDITAGLIEYENAD